MQNVVVVAGGPRAGDAEAGVVAAAYGAQVAAWSGGVLSMFGPLIIG